MAAQRKHPAKSHLCVPQKSLDCYGKLRWAAPVFLSFQKRHLLAEKEFVFSFSWSQVSMSSMKGTATDIRTSEHHFTGNGKRNLPTSHCVLFSVLLEVWLK